MNLGRMIAVVVLPLAFVGMMSQLPACLDNLQAGGGSDAGDDGAALCSHAMAPLPPNSADDPSKDVTFVTAMKTVYFAGGPQGEPLGLDLDRYCTCQGETPSCIAPNLQDPDLQCDDPEGRDNGSKAYFSLVAAMLLVDGPGQLQELCSSFAELGRWSILMRVSGYNGLPDDPNVRVEWLPSHGTSNPPQWQGDDIWPIAQGVLDPDGGPRYYDQNAYVAKGKLVFSLPEGNMQIGNGLMQLNIHFVSSTIMATIDQDVSGRYGLHNGVLAGRIPLAELFQMVAEFRNHNGAPFCANEQNPFYAATRDAFCRGLDIQAGVPQLNKKCDAVSLGLGFEAEAIAAVGMVENSPNGQMSCPPGEDPYSAYLDAGCPQSPPMPQIPPDANTSDGSP